MFQLRSLQHQSYTSIAAAFNDAFSDYIIPIKLSAETLTAKMLTENILLENSVGVFEEEKLIAFILTGIDVYNGKMTAYNAGTGVIPHYRGNRLTKKMYEYLIPFLHQQNIVNHQLEVITTNTKALAVYKQIGFAVNRTLCCFKGMVTENKAGNDIVVRVAEDHSIFNKQFFDSEPSWQNQLNCILRDKANHVFLSAVAGNQPAGFLIYAPAAARIKLFAVDKKHRRNGIGSALFSFVQNSLPGKDISIINIDEFDTGTIAFVRSAGLQPTVQQFEMLLP